MGAYSSAHKLLDCKDWIAQTFKGQNDLNQKIQTIFYAWTGIKFRLSPRNQRSIRNPDLNSSHSGRSPQIASLYWTWIIFNEYWSAVLIACLCGLICSRSQNKPMSAAKIMVCRENSTLLSGGNPTCRQHTSECRCESAERLGVVVRMLYWQLPNKRLNALAVFPRTDRNHPPSLECLSSWEH